MSYQNKYLKYKKKYLDYKYNQTINQTGGVNHNLCNNCLKMINSNNDIYNINKSFLKNNPDLNKSGGAKKKNWNQNLIKRFHLIIHQV